MSSVSSVSRRQRKFSNESMEIINAIINTDTFKKKNRGSKGTPLTDEQKESVRNTQNINSAIYYYKNKYQIKAKNLIKKNKFTDEQMSEYEAKPDWANKFFYLLIQSKI